MQEKNLMSTNLVICCLRWLQSVFRFFFSHCGLTCYAAEHTYNMLGERQMKSAGSRCSHTPWPSYIPGRRRYHPRSSHPETAHSHKEQPVFVCVSWRLLRNINLQKGKATCLFGHLLFAHYEILTDSKCWLNVSIFWPFDNWRIILLKVKYFAFSFRTGIHFILCLGSTVACHISLFTCYHHIIIL